MSMRRAEDSARLIHQTSYATHFTRFMGSQVYYRPFEDDPLEFRDPIIKHANRSTFVTKDIIPIT